jgi:hypothetical protein
MDSRVRLMTLSNQNVWRPTTNIRRQISGLIFAGSSIKLHFLFCFLLLSFRVTILSVVVTDHLVSEVIISMIVNESRHDKTNIVRLRPTFAHSDQDPCCSLSVSLLVIGFVSEQHGSWSDCADAQAGLDPCWSQTHYVGFVVTRLI